MGSKHKTSCFSRSFSSSRLLGTGLLQIFQVLFVIRIHFRCFDQSSRFFSLQGFGGIFRSEIGSSVDPHLDLILAEFCSELVFLGLLARCNLRFPVLPNEMYCNVTKTNTQRIAWRHLPDMTTFTNRFPGKDNRLPGTLEPVLHQQLISMFLFHLTLFERLTLAFNTSIV